MGLVVFECVSDVPVSMLSVFAGNKLIGEERDEGREGREGRRWREGWGEGEGREREGLIAPHSWHTWRQ